MSIINSHRTKILTAACQKASASSSNPSRWFSLSQCRSYARFTESRDPDSRRNHGFRDPEALRRLKADRMNDHKSDFRPFSAAFYTGNPFYNDLIDFLVDAHHHYSQQAMEVVPDFKATPTPVTHFLDRIKMAYNLRMPISQPQYELLLEKIATLDAYRDMLPPALSEDLAKCKRPGIRDLENQSKRELQDRHGNMIKVGGVELQTGGVPAIDEHGRTVCKGGRKSARARVWLIEGDGLLFVNGRPLVDYFPRLHHREQVLYPFDIVDMVGQYNLWAVVFGGGHSGQAGAVQHALAKALVFQNSNRFGNLLDAAGLLTRDSRMVERKKPGQLKARRKFTWVKR